MSKLATVKGLNDTGPQLQIVAAVRDLQQIMSSIQTDMNNLPSAVATELSSLGTLAESLDKALTAQRQTLDTLSREATASLEQRLTEIMESQRRDATQLRQTLEGLQVSVEAIQRASKLPKQIEGATAIMRATATDLARNRIWVFISAIVASAVLSATLAVAGVQLLNRAGTPDLNRPVQPSAPAAQNQGDVWQRLRSLEPAR